MAIKERKVVKLSAEDKARVVRLEEEVKGRLDEIASIICRNLGIEKGAVQFTPHSHEEKNPGGAASDLAPRTSVKIVCTPDGHICGCEDSNTGTCHMC